MRADEKKTKKSLTNPLGGAAPPMPKSTIKKIIFLRLAPWQIAVMCYIVITMNARNIKHSDGKGESFAVSRHIILRNFWEYYVEEPNENGITFGFVMGFANEWGSVDYNEIKPYIISEAKGTALNDVMPPADYYWEDEEN